MRRTKIMQNFNTGMKAGILIALLSGAAMDTLILIDKPIPDFVAWCFAVGAVIAIASAIVSAFVKRKSNKMEENQIGMNNMKKDKGFELFYENLSDRRKFIRTVWVTAIAVTFVVFLAIMQADTIGILIFGIIMGVGCVWQLITTYRQWKHPKE
jgi:ABC-type sugar transport system permease subunit